jgi:RNA polymerase sigma-70 factor (ECF subfamily)
MNEDEQAALFRQWFGQYAGLMDRVARAYTAAEADCEDLIQEILLQVWRSIPRFKRKASPSTWLYRVALNTALAWQRRDQHRRRFRPLVEVADVAEDNRGQLQEGERIERLYAAVRPDPDGKPAANSELPEAIERGRGADRFGPVEEKVAAARHANLLPAVRLRQVGAALN